METDHPKQCHYKRIEECFISDSWRRGRRQGDCRNHSVLWDIAAKPASLPQINIGMSLDIHMHRSIMGLCIEQALLQGEQHIKNLNSKQYPRVESDTLTTWPCVCKACCEAVALRRNKGLTHVRTPVVGERSRAKNSTVAVTSAAGPLDLAYAARLPSCPARCPIISTRPLSA